MSRKWFELGPFTVFDVETTGLSPKNDRIVEIAAVRVDCDNKKTRFHHLVNPGRRIPLSAQRVHHISDEMVSEEPGFSLIGEKFIEFSENSTLVAHNARFDLGFLQESLFRERLELWNGKTMDSIPLMKQAYPDLPSYSLPYLRERFGLNSSAGQAHRAFADVEWTLEVLEMALTVLLKHTK